ncbi:MAG: carboxypeptidase regulatory-like domain-containing protein [Nitrospirae bacterium]|nr:carboxypeptidase regulatory-like domain-containing protein [Nitrospirota bacterium]
MNLNRSLSVFAALFVALAAACEKNDLGDPLTVRTGSVVGRVTLLGEAKSQAAIRLEGTNTQTTSDAKGGFRLDLAAPGKNVLTAFFDAPEGSTYGIRRDIEIVEGEVLGLGEVALAQVGAVAGEVKLQDRRTHLGSDVFVPGTEMWTQTSTDGSYTLTRVPPGFYRLVAANRDFEMVEYAEFEVASGETTVLPAIELHRRGEDSQRGALSGRVFSLVGRPLEGAIVSMIPPIRTATTGEDGGYEFKDLDPAEYLLRAELEGKVTGSKRAVVRANETATAHLALPALPNQDKPGRGGWNSEPRLMVTCPESVRVGESAGLRADAMDSDGDPVTLGPFAATGGAFSSPSDGEACEPEEGGVCATAEWKAPDRPGLYMIRSTASDGQLMAEASCEIAVSRASGPDNHCPMVAITGATRTLVARHVSLAVSGSDQEGDPISYNWSASGGSLDRRTGEEVIWTAPRSAGDYDVSVCASDGQCAKSCATARINVGEEAEKATFPACGISGPTLASGGSVVGLWAATYDPNAFPVKVQWSATGGTFPIPEGALANWSAPAQSGMYTVSAKATAASGSTATCQMGIVVTDSAAVRGCPTLDVQGSSTSVKAMPVRVEFVAEGRESGGLSSNLSCDTPNGPFQTFDVSAEGAVFEWFPLFEGVYTFSCKIAEGSCAVGRLHSIAVTDRPDDLPPFVGVSCTADKLLPGQSTLCLAFGKDPKDQEVTFTWSVAAGTLSSLAGDSVMWTAPPAGGEYRIAIVGSDGANEARSSHSLRVGAPRSVTDFSPSDAVPEGEYACDASTVALYHFNETEGATAQDTCGSHPAVIRGAAVNRAGRWVGAYSFDGWDDSVEIPAAAVSGLANGTVEAWVKLTATWRDYEWAIRRSEEADQCDLRMRYTARTQSWGATWNNECVDINHKLDRNTATDFGWHHLAVTWDGVLWKMYQDGLLRVASPDVAGLESNDNPLVIGLVTAGVESALYGMVDELRISDRAREPEEFRVLAAPVSPIWTDKSAMAGARADAASAAVEGKLYVFGGRKEENEALSTNEEFDLLKDSWSSKKDMPTDRWDAVAVAIGRRVHLIGGTRFKDKPLLVAKNEEYDTEKDAWSKRADWPRPRFGAVAAAVDGQVFVLGGSSEFQDQGSLPQVDRYDPVTDGWTERAPIPTARSHAAVAVRAGSIYVIGGASDEGFRNSTERYDARSDTWSILAPMPTPRKSAVALVDNDFIYVIGGEDGSTLKVVEAYDPVRNTWTSLDPLPDPRTRFVGTVFQRLLFLVGGYDGTAVLSSVLQGFLFPPRPE